MKEIYLDLETLRTADQVSGGWRNIAGMGLTVACTWDDEHLFRDWYEEDAPSLVDELATFEMVVGFNTVRFDYEVLRSYVPEIRGRLRHRSFDLLDDISKRLGFRVSLDNVSQATLGRGKSGHGLDAIRWWRMGRRDLVVQYCQDDVALTRDVHRYGRDNQHIYYVHKQFGTKTRLPVLWP